MELSKPGQTNALPSDLSSSQPLSSSDNQLPIFTSANWTVTQNRPNNTIPASPTVRPFNAPSRILMPWESVAVQSPNSNLPRPEKLPNTPNNPASNKRLPQMELSPKPIAPKGTSKASNKRTIQQVEVSPKAQSAAAIESVRSKLTESLAAALSPSTGEKANLGKEDGQNDQSMIDELLQGNGLSWAENTQNKPDDNMFKAPREDEKSLATKIEAELFGLFGGVNKKYKEKGRSLLFNLKDQTNPDLRERVISGDIRPEKLCLMSVEELASKELSEWRQAKAEEMAQAIVLPDEDVDMRKRVKKTHKGEFVVMDDEDSSWAPLEAEIKSGASVGTSTGRVEQAVKDSKVKDEGDLMLEIMVDGFVDVDHLSPVVTLDEFMKDLDSEPPIFDLGISNAEEAAAQGPASAQTKPSVEKEEESIADSDLKDEQVPSGETSGNVKQESTSVVTTSNSVDKKEDMEGKVASVDESIVKSGPVVSKLDGTDGKKNGEHGEALWEGVVQLNVSSLASVVAFYKSGEKPSMKEWPGFIEIKGRVRLDPFEKFLKELPLSRTRAIMIVEIKWKETSIGSGRKNLSETIESYVADSRVGFAEPCPGVEMYLSPTNEKMLEMFIRLLPKEHSDNLKASTKSLVGVVVWRRPLVTTVSPKSLSHHNQQSTSNRKSNNNNSRRKEQVINSNSPKPSRSSISARDPVKQAPSKNNCHDEDDGDVPPGFGHMVNRADINNNNNNHSTKNRSRNYDDDLPEFNFGSASKSANKGVSSVVRPVQQIRDLIHKYGQGTDGSGGPGTGTGVTFKKPIIETKPWNANDDDDIPEWNPKQGNQLHVNSVPPQPPQASPHSMHTAQNLPPMQAAAQYATATSNQQILQPPPEPIVHQPTTALRPAINMQPNYQATSQWWGQGGPGQVDMVQPPSQFPYRMPSTGWRPDFQGSRGA